MVWSSCARLVVRTGPFYKYKGVFVVEYTTAVNPGVPGGRGIWLVKHTTDPLD